MKADPSRYLEFRRDIHRHPELSNQEVETTRRIREFLARDGLELCPIGALNGGFVRINADSVTDKRRIVSECIADKSVLH